MRVRVIVNPVAGRRGRRGPAGLQRVEFARAWLDGRQHESDVIATSRRGHAAALAREFVSEGVDRIVAWGGDGTVNEVAGPLIGSHSVLGIVPGGSGDGLAGGLKVPSDPHEAFELAVSDHTLRLDVGWLGDRHFVNAAGVGFDAMVAYAFSQRRRRGFAGYLAAGFGSVASYHCATYTLDLDGETSTAPRFMVAFGNGREYGNGFVLAPDADPTDGYLDAVVVAEGSIVRQLWRARRLLLAPGVDEPGIARLRVRRAQISGPTDLMAHVDGEPFVVKGPVTVRVEPSALAVAIRRWQPQADNQGPS